MGLGAFLGLTGLGALTLSTGQPWLIGSFGASGVLLFAYPQGPFSQVRHVIGGHLLTSLVALVCLQVLGPGVLPMAFAGALGWSFLLAPTLGGACFLMLTAWLYWKGIRWLQQRVKAPSTSKSL
jgi:CBS-domain-containing membrane protein